MNIKNSLIIFSIFLPTISFARAGGGEGNGLLLTGGAALVAAPILGIWYAIYTIRRNKMLAKAAGDLATASQSDLSWNLKEIKKIAKDTFHAYQIAWSRQNLEPVRDLLHIDYYEVAAKEIETQIAAGERNVLKSIKLSNMELISIRDVENQDGDMFVMEMDAQMIDYTIEVATNTFISSPIMKNSKESLDQYIARAKLEPDEFTEFWVFIRQSNKWLLWKIEQSDSIIKDLKKMSIEEVNAVLEREKQSTSVNDSVFYSKK